LNFSVWTDVARVVITNTAILSNTSYDLLGAGIANQYNTELYVSGSTISGNAGAGIGMQGADTRNQPKAVIKNSLISNNLGSGIAAGEFGLPFAAVWIWNTTISGNQGYNCAAIDAWWFLSGTFLTIVGNRSSGTLSSVCNSSDSPLSVSLRFSIIADNSPKNCGTSWSSPNQYAGSFSTDDSCPGAQQVGASDLKLGPLQVNPPGATATHALLPGSVAIDSVSLQDCQDPFGRALTEDQRGVSRPQGPKCDAGAFEAQAVAPTPTPTPTPTPSPSPGPLPTPTPTPTPSVPPQRLYFPLVAKQ